MYLNHEDVGKINNTHLKEGGMRYLICAICWGVVALLVSPGIAGNFPYRDKYPEVNVVELSDLKGGYDKGEFILVEVRAKGEFDTIQIKNAVNIPYGNAHFSRDINRLAKSNPNKKIAVYDNGCSYISNLTGMLRTPLWSATTKTSQSGLSFWISSTIFC